MRPAIGITCGDPHGVGPEIALKTARDPRVRRACRAVLFGPAEVFALTARRLRFSLSNVDIISTGKFPGPLHFGRLSPRAGAASLAAIDGALDAVGRGEIDAVVTAPVSKAAIAKAGHPSFTGHTEYVARFAGVKDFCLALYAGRRAIAFVSTHVPLRRAVRLARRPRVMVVAMLLHSFLKTLGHRRPVIGVGGLNPHAGEGGLLGGEEQKEIIPAIAALRRRRMVVRGPLPPDVIFAELFGGRLDGVVSMIHDHGHVAFKTYYFTLRPGRRRVSGVNVTLGLPFIRTSADHGTAFDIAGKNLADPSSLKEAVALAVELARGGR